jgi:hypothetical protein
VAPGVFERHSTGCSRSHGRRGCDCSPVYVARVRVGGRLLSGTFPNLADAVAWVQQAKWTLRAGGRPNVRPAAPTLHDAAVSFLHRARGGTALTRSRRPYALNTLAGYETTLRLHVLPWPEPRSGLSLGSLPSDAIDTRTIQNMVDALSVNRSNETARVAYAALAAVLRDLYSRGLIESLPPESAAAATRPAARAGADRR